MFNTDLSGTLPLDELSGLSDLEVLHLGTDKIRGWVNYFERLESNYERRSMPSSIRNLQKLKYLRINAGALSGTIPSEIGELTSLGEWRRRFALVLFLSDGSKPDLCSANSPAFCASFSAVVQQLSDGYHSIDDRKPGWLA